LSDLIPLTGLWSNTDKNGNMTLSGNMGSARLVIFKNTHKKEDNQPDYNLYVTTKKPKESN